MPATTLSATSAATRSRISDPGTLVKYLFLLSSLLLPGVLHAQQTPDFISGFVGTYAGDVFNGDDLDPIITIFSVAAGNRLTGNYTVNAEQFDYEGVISNIVFEDARTITGEWTDRFGEGVFRLQFSQNFDSFTGYWSDYESDNQLPWSGTRQ